MPVKAAGGSLISDAKLKELYASMLRSRLSKGKASLGQEAITTGCVIDLRPEDTIVDTVGVLPGVPLQPLKLATEAALANNGKSGNVVVVFSSAAARAGLMAAVKFAAARSLPIIFVVENNPWALKARERRSLKTQLKGLTGIVVDGNDVVAVYRVAYESLERVRKGGGPVLIEGKRYRQDGQGLVRGERDPLAHMEQYLAAKGLFTQRWKDQLVQRFSR